MVTMFIFKNKASKIKIPWFIGYFVLAILLNTYVPIEGISTIIPFAAKSGLNLTLFLIGSTLSVQALKGIGLKPLLFAVLLWAFVSMGSLLCILYMK